MTYATGKRIDKIFDNVNSILSEGLDELTNIRLDEYQSYQNLQEEYRKIQDKVEEVMEANKKCHLECKKAREELMESARSGNEKLEKGAYFNVETLMRLRGTLEERERSLCIMRDNLAISIKRKKELLDKTEVLRSRFRMALEIIDSGSHIATPDKDGLLAAAIGIAERESAHLARELHDGPAQGFGNVVLVADLAEQYLIRKQPLKTLEELARLKSIVNDTYNEVRSFLHRLSPPGLEDGLDYALEMLINRLTSRYNVDIEFNFDGNLDFMSLYVRSNIYKVISQQIINAIKHGKCNTIKIRITAGDEFFISRVEDDGCGFDVEEVLSEGNEKGCYGVRNMQERVKLAGGELRIESSAGAGSRIITKVPIKTDDIEE